MVETVFIWRVKEGEKTPGQVIVTGDFDGWKSTHTLEYNETANEFHKDVSVDFGGSDKIFFKFVVDGEWMTSDAYKSEANGEGIVNNYITHSDIGADVLTSEVEDEVKGSGEQKRKFKIKRVVRTNKKTGERVVVSQEVVPLDENDNPITESMENSVEPEKKMMEDEKPEMQEDMKKEEAMKEDMKKEEAMKEEKQEKSQPRKKEPVKKAPAPAKKAPTPSKNTNMKRENSGFMKKVKKFFAPR